MTLTLETLIVLLWIKFQGCSNVAVKKIPKLKDLSFIVHIKPTKLIYKTHIIKQINFKTNHMRLIALIALAIAVSDC